MTKYFGVIGNRDYIKHAGQKRHFWEFLDRQPDGWLSSLTYARTDLPETGPMIWDCGAWSYRESEPKWDASTVVAQYLKFARTGDWVIAPDHMLIGDDLESRRIFNRRSAELFLTTCPAWFTPIVTIHGTTADERVEAAKLYARMGYSVMALGGMAANAARKQMMIEHATRVREAVPGVWLHVLGLSSPDYMAAWRRIGINSADGSSHFKQAFTGGAFFTQQDAKLHKHQAARPGEDVAAPLCECKACSMLRDEKIDTRTYGSNEHNMGRAAHNLNMLMRAQVEAMKQTVVLVACCGEKLSGTHKAQDIYQSALFKKSRMFAERVGDKWLILSAKYGVLHPDDVISDYDLTLNNMGSAKRREWSEGVGKVLRNLHGSDRLIVLAGENYCGWTYTFGGNVKRPLCGLGIGEQLAWLTEQNAVQMNLFAKAKG